MILFLVDIFVVPSSGIVIKIHIQFHLRAPADIENKLLYIK